MNIQCYCLAAALTIGLFAGGAGASAQESLDVPDFATKRVMVVFPNGMTRHSEDGGNTWVDGPFQTDEEQGLVQSHKLEVRFISSHGASYRSLDGGTTWTREQSGSEAVTSAGEEVGHNDPRIGIFPNPLRQDGRMSFSLQQSARVVMQLFDQQGREVAEPFTAEYGAGDHEVTMNCATLAPGFYLYSLTIGTTQHSGMIQIIK